MPHNSTTTQEKFTNFSRRFKRDSSGYFSHRGSSTEGASTTSPSDLLSTTSPSSRQTQTSPNALTTSDEGMSRASASGSLTSDFNLRMPAAQRKFEGVRASTKEFVLPDLPWLCGTWHICASSLPMWRNKRNVRVEYTRITGDKLDDIVSYQNRDATTIRKLHGVDRPKKNGSFSWRGKGRMSVASSRWEILGWSGGGGSQSAGTAGHDGVVEVAAAPAPAENTEQWIVTYYARTLFTEAGVDIYARKSSGLKPDTLRKLKLAINRLGGRETEFGRIAEGIVDVRHDGARKDMVSYREEDATLENV